MGIERNTEPEKIVAPSETGGDSTGRNTPQQNETPTPPDSVVETEAPADNGGEDGSQSADSERLTPPNEIDEQEDDNQTDGSEETESDHTPPENTELPPPTEVENDGQEDDGQTEGSEGAGADGETTEHLTPPDEIDEQEDDGQAEGLEGAGTNDETTEHLTPPDEIDDISDEEEGDSHLSESDAPPPSEIPDDQESEHVEGSPNVTDSDASATSDATESDETASARNESNTDTQTDEQDTSTVTGSETRTDGQENPDSENSNTTETEDSGESDSSNHDAETTESADIAENHEDGDGNNADAASDAANADTSTASDAVSSETSKASESNADNVQANETTQNTGDTADTATETGQQETTGSENNDVTAAENSGASETSPNTADTANVSDENADNTRMDESAQDADNTSSNTGFGEKPVSNEGVSLTDTLQSFEQRNWETLSLDDKKACIGELNDHICDHLGLENKPEIRYFSAEESSYGGYSKTENAIYINENALDNGRATADTVAHEARHAWQHERAENPQTEEDYKLKASLENYIDPTHNYDGYKNQFAEIDARDFANKIANNLSDGHMVAEPITVSVDPVPKSDSFSETNPNRGAVFDESAPPDDTNLKRGSEVAVESIHDGRSYAEAIRPILCDTALSKDEVVSEALGVYERVPPGQRTDINAVNNPAAVKAINREGGYMEIAFHGFHGLDERQPIRGMFNADGSSNLPEILYRQGSPYGNNLTTNNPDGSKPTNDQLSIPYVDNPEAQHTYRIDAEAYKQAIDIIKDVDTNDISDIEAKTAMLNQIIDNMNEKYGLSLGHVHESFVIGAVLDYRDFQGLDVNGSHLRNEATWQCRNSDWHPNTTYGVCGAVAPMYINNDPSQKQLYPGGAPQFNTPGPIINYVRLGVLQEENNDNS